MCAHIMSLQDPSQRLSIAEIKAHPWFLDTLPRNALTLSDRFLAEPMPGRARGECGAGAGPGRKGVRCYPRNVLTLSDRFGAEPMPGKARGG